MSRISVLLQPARCFSKTVEVTSKQALLHAYWVLRNMVRNTSHRKHFLQEIGTQMKSGFICSCKMYEWVSSPLLKNLEVSIKRNASLHYSIFHQHCLNACVPWGKYLESTFVYQPLPSLLAACLRLVYLVEGVAVSQLFCWRLLVKTPPAPCPSGRPPCSFPHTLLWEEMREERSLYTCRVCCLVGWWSLRDQELTGNPAPGPGCSGFWIANRSMGESQESHWDPCVFRQTYECEHHCNDAPFWRLSQSYLFTKILVPLLGPVKVF